MMILEVAPQEVVKAFYPQGIARCQVLRGGEINTTLLVTDKNDQKTILQRLNFITDDLMAADYQLVSAHLRNLAWEIAMPLETQDGSLYVRDAQNKFWQALTYLDSTPGYLQEGSFESSIQLAALLGKLHADLRSLAYSPKAIPADMFDTPYYSNRLNELLPSIYSQDAQALAAEILMAAKDNMIVRRPPQIIHGDPRIANTLFRNGKPFTFIDWEGLKEANPLIDVGDFLQAVTGEMIVKLKRSPSAPELRQLLDAYYSNARLPIDIQEFVQNALCAGRYIALVGGMRHLIDCVEDRYFAWDPKKFSSRMDFNLFCVRRQWQAYSALL